LIAQLDPQSPESQRATALANDCLGIVRQREAPALEDWLRRTRASGVAELRDFVASLEQDVEAVRAALTLPWSNGAVEGHINRLTLVKRQMDGRASLELLRTRVLHAA
jgi:transposase